MTAESPPLSLKEMPGPDGHWLLGNFSAFNEDQVRFLSEVRDNHDGIAKIRLGPVTAVLITKPDYVKQVLAGHHYKYIPLGGGPRICIGRNFSIIEGQSALVLMVRDFDFRLNEKQPTRVEYEAAVTLRPRNGMYIDLKQISN